MLSAATAAVVAVVVKTAPLVVKLLLRWRQVQCDCACCTIETAAHVQCCVTQNASHQIQASAHCKRVSAHM
jgi:hypothetical protein